MKDRSAPISLVVSHVFNFGQPVPISIGRRADSPTGVSDWSVRAVATFLFPTGG